MTSFHEYIKQCSMNSDSGEEVLGALTLACSQDPSLLKVGEGQLEAWKREKGFYTTLAGIFANRELDTTVRWMAITYLKNGVQQFWRRGAPFGIANKERPFIKSAIVQCFEEPVSQVANQIAELTARIARIDCPDDWPELLPILTEGVRSSSEFTRKCYLHIFKVVIKTLAGRRLMNQRKVFQELTTSVFVYIVGLWNTHLQGGVAMLSEGNIESAVSTLQLAKVCLKILRHMIVHGMVKFHAIIEALQFVSTLIERIPALLQLRSQLPEDHPAREIVEKNIQLKMKILQEVQAHQSLGYSQFVGPSLELIRTLMFTPENEDKLFEKLAISCLNFLRVIIKCEDYNPPKAELSQSVLPPGVMEAHRAKLSFFKASVCEAMLERLVGHYLLLSEEELENWNTNTEEFFQDKVGETHQYSFRECAENAAIAMVYEFQPTLAPALIAMIQAVQATNHSAGFQAIRLKEAVYKAAGLCAFQLYDDLNFDEWYQSQLLQELTVLNPEYKIVRHRVVWVIGSWVTVKLSNEFRPSVYSIMVPLLARNEDLATRLAAAEVIRTCADDFDFTVEDFSPFLSDAMSALFQLLLDVQTPDTKMKVLNTLSLLLERMGVAIQPHLSSLLQYLPQLWVESADASSSMLRCIILTTLNNIVKGLGPLSVNLHSFVIPVLQLATDVKEPEHVYLAEDGLTLWLTTVHNSPSPSPDLLHLLGNMVGLLGVSSVSDESSSSLAGLMDIGSDSLGDCFKIMNGYVVLCASEPDQFMQLCAEIIVAGCRYYLCDVKPEGVVSITKVISQMARVFPKHMAQLVQPLLPMVLRKLMDEDDYPPTTSVFLDLIGRVLISDAAFFFSFLERMAAESQQTATHLFGLLVDVWSDRLDSVNNVKCRKLTGLAIANLFPIADPCVTSRYGAVVNMCVEVLHDVMDQAESGEQIDTLLGGSDDTTDKDQPLETEHDKREKQLCQFDPVRTVALNQHVTAKLEESVAVHGHHGYTALMSGVDPSVRGQLFEFVPTHLATTLLALDSLS